MAIKTFELVGGRNGLSGQSRRMWPLIRHYRQVLVSAAGSADCLCVSGKGSRGAFVFLFPGWRRPADLGLVPVTSSARTKTDCMSLPPAILTLAVFQPYTTDQAACSDCGNALTKVASLLSWGSMMAYRCGFSLLRNNISSSRAAVAGTPAPSRASYLMPKCFLNSPIDLPDFCLSWANLFCPAIPNSWMFVCQMSFSNYSPEHIWICLDKEGMLA